MREQAYLVINKCLEDCQEMFLTPQEMGEKAQITLKEFYKKFHKESFLPEIRILFHKNSFVNVNIFYKKEKKDGRS